MAAMGCNRHVARFLPTRTAVADVNPSVVSHNLGQRSIGENLNGNLAIDRLQRRALERFALGVIRYRSAR